MAPATLHTVLPSLLLQAMLHTVFPSQATLHTVFPSLLLQAMLHTVFPCAPDKTKKIKKLLIIYF